MVEKYNVSIVSLGCAKNHVDAEIMLGLLKESGYDITENKDEADVIIINTCGFIESAKTEAIEAILDAAEYKKSARCKAVIATGCLTQRYSQEVIEQIPEADGVLGIDGYDKIAEAVKACLEGKRYVYCDYVGDVSYLDSARILSGPKGSAYLKISEGCDNRCAYCAIPDIRGPFRSRTKESVIAEAERLAAAGVKELVVVAQDTSRYGKDLYGKPVLAELLYELNKISAIEWIRVMYLYPDEIASELIEAMKKCEKVIPYVDLPLQHINGRILKAMNRRGTPDDIKNVLKQFKNELDRCVIRTSIIVGFPGETDEEFDELLEFVKDVRFDRLGAFCFSPEEGTLACKMKGKIKKAVKQDRYNRLMECQQIISREINESRVGEVYDVLVEGVSDDGIFYYGRSYAEGPDVDGRIYFTANDPLFAGDMVKVKILIAEEYDLTGCQI